MIHQIFGIYRAIVVDNADPLGQQRLLLRIPQVMGLSVSSWAEPSYPRDDLANSATATTTATATATSSSTTTTTTNNADGSTTTTTSTPVTNTATNSNTATNTAATTTLYPLPLVGQMVMAFFVGGDPESPAYIS